MWRRSSVITGLVFLALLAAYPAMANHSWGGYHWDGSGTALALTLEDNLDNSWNLSPVVDDWNADDTLDLSVVQGDGPTVCDDPLGINTPSDLGEIEVCNDDYGSSGWLGVARIWIDDDGEHITAAVAAVNDYYFNQPTYDDANARRHVLCQEVGHTFGLDHQRSPRNQTCMNDQWGLTSSSFVSPNAHDYEQLADIYAHLDGATDGGGGGDDGSGPCKNNPDHWKCSSGSSPGPHSVERLPNGQIVITWITWAPGLTS